MHRLSVFACLLACLAWCSATNRAIVALSGKDNVKGSVTLEQLSDGVLIQGQVIGLEPGLHGFHVHALGDLSNGCDSTGGHYNPTNATHGAPTDRNRHAGDLGNIEADASGVAMVRIFDSFVSLGGQYCILGRAIVVHSGEDDLGRGGSKDSLTTGNAGSRVACGVIGIL